MKKVFSILLLISLFGAQAAMANGSSVFTDVGTNSPYYEALKYLKEGGIVSGYSDGSFKPGNSINRAEFTKIIAGAVASKQELTSCKTHYTSKDGSTSNVFTDVTFNMASGDKPVWFFDYVCVAKFRGFVDGYADGSFRPTQKINFVEAAKIITEALDYQMSSTTPWYKSYVQKLEEKKAIPTTIKSFNQNITRGEMAEMIWRLRALMTNLPSAKYSDLK